MMTRSAAAEPLIARNPSTGLELARYPATPLGDVADITEKATIAQAGWAEAPWKPRRTALRFGLSASF